MFGVCSRPKKEEMADAYGKGDEQIAHDSVRATVRALDEDEHAADEESLDDAKKDDYRKNIQYRSLQKDSSLGDTKPRRKKYFFAISRLRVRDLMPTDEVTKSGSSASKVNPS
jgi:hypothetical protein